MRIYDRILAGSLIIGLFLTFFLVIQKPLYVDEITHFSAISNFCKSNYTYPPWLTTIPGYHFFGGLFGSLTSCTESSIRFFNLLLSFVSIGVVFYLSKALGTKYRKEKVLAFALLPILLPFFFLIYTDVMSLLFVLLTFYFSVKQNYLLGGVFGLLSFVVRQNNVLFILFCAAYVVFDNRFSWKKIISVDQIKKVLPYIVILIIAGAFFVKNGGFAIGDRAQHPAFYIGFMNIYTALFFLFWLNLPEHIFNLKKIGRFISGLGTKKVLALIGLFALFFIFFILTFKIDHPYNNYEIYWHFFRNKVVHLFDSSIILRAVFFAFVAFFLLVLGTLYLQN